MTLDIKDRLTGDIRRLIDFNGLNRERGVNGEKLISLNTFDTDMNRKSYPYVKEENIITFDGEDYVIKEVSKKPIGRTYYKEVVCIHKFFCDMREDRIYESYTQSFTFSNILNTIFNLSGYTFEIIGTFLAESFENFGDGKDKLDLFNEVLGRYSAEFEILTGNVIRLSKRKGLTTPTFKLLFNHNIKTIDYKQNTNNLSTYIKGYGKKNEDGTYMVQGSYTSPNAALFPADTPDGLRHAPPIKNDNITIQATLDQALEEALIDVPEVSITLSFADMRKYGYPFEVPNDGDDVYLIHEPFGLDLTVRIIRIVEYFNKNLEPIDSDVELGNPRENITDQFNSTDKKLGQILDPNGRVRLSYLDEQTKRLSEALATVETELEFNNGIIARDPSNPNRVVILNSLGLCISADGGATVTEAITWQGFVLTAGAIGQLDADNIRVGAMTGSDIPALSFNSDGLRASTTDPTKYVELNGSGLISKKGALTVERPDGYQVINDGYLNMEFALGSSKPSWREENAADPTQGVTVFNTYWRTRSTTWKTCDAFFFEHKTRYLHFDFALFTENISGSRAYVKVVDSLTNPTTLAYYSTDVIEANVDPNTNFVIDLGVPTGVMKVVYIQIQNLLDTAYAYCRTTRQYLKG